MVDDKSRNTWLGDKLCEMYVRKGQRFLPPSTKGIEPVRITTLDLANINVFEPGQMFFSKLLLPWLKKLCVRHKMPLYVESILNNRFYKFLLRRGFKRIPGALDQSNLIWYPPDHQLLLWCRDYCVPIYSPIIGQPDCSIGCWAMGRNDLFDEGFKHEELWEDGIEITLSGVTIFKYQRPSKSKDAGWSKQYPDVA